MKIYVMHQSKMEIDSELLKSFSSDIHGGYLEILQTTSSPEPIYEMEVCWIFFLDKMQLGELLL